MDSINAVEGGYSRTLKSIIPSDVSAHVPFWMLSIVIILLFCQLWIDVAGLTIRLQDILIGAILIKMFPAIFKLKITYWRSFLNAPILLWGIVIIVGVIVTFLHEYTPVLKKDSLVNAGRLLLALSLFFIVNNHGASASVKLRLLVRAIVGFSFITTLVSLLQIGYWAGWLPFSLPRAFVTFAEGANTARGREIFGLFLGDTGSHTWAGMLAMQALVVWLLASRVRNQVWRIAAYSYFGLLFLILVRISVRNSILGLLVVVLVLSLLSARYSRYPMNRLVKPLIFILAALGGILVLFTLFPDSYFIERVREVIPQWQQGEIHISRRSNIFGRLWIAEMAVAMFRDSPILGMGFYSFREASMAWSRVIMGETRTIVHAHNSYFQTLSEMGVVGAVALAWIAWRVTNLLLRTRFFLKQSRSHHYMWQLVFGNTLFLAFTAMFSNTLWFPYYVSLNMILLAILASMYRELAGEHQ